MKLSNLSIIILIGTFTLSATAQDKPGGKVHGYVFGDYYYVISADTAASRGMGQYSSTPKDFQGFQFRRLYLYYDHTFNETFAAQFLLEGTDKSLDPGGRYGVFVKTAYLEWKNIFRNSNLWFGLIPTPTWSLLSEKVWNYRSIEKTVTDFRGLGSASDLGVGLRGKIDDEGMLNYVLMIGNGTGQKPENNKYKKYYASLSVKPVKEFVVEGYVDYEPAADDKNKTTLKGFAAYQTARLTIGTEVLQQTQAKAGMAGADRSPFCLSLFAWAEVPNVQGLNVFARYDFYNPDTKVSSTGFNENFMTVGLDYMPIPNVHIMPNLWLNSYSAKGTGSVNADVVGRVTFFYIYK